MSEKIIEVLEKIYNDEPDIDPFGYVNFNFLSTDINFKNKTNNSIKSQTDINEPNSSALEQNSKTEIKYDGSRKKILMDHYYETIGEDSNENLIKRENIIEQIGMNNLAFYFYIDDIRYDFLFTKDNITMLDYSTGNTLSIDYYDKRIISFVFKKMGIPKEKYFDC